MKRFVQKLTRFLLTMLLMASTLSCPSFADWKLVPAGWTAAEPGYFGALNDGRDTLAALQTYRQTSERWKAAYSGLRTEFLTAAGDIKKQMAKLEDQLNNERKAWKAQAVRERTNKLLWIALAGGIGYAIGR